jgi:hypothetical protein
MEYKFCSIYGMLKVGISLVLTSKMYEISEKGVIFPTHSNLK